MSGFVGIVNFDGAPVDPSLLSRMTDLIAYRGPHGRHEWVDGAVGFGHTLLRDTWESEHEQQPLTLDGVTIVANARMDARAELLDRLRGAGRDLPKDSPDVALILHAYLAWGDACLEHLYGDFVFVIWDSRSQRVFAARDQFGLHGIYYARKGSTLIFSNEIKAICLHPAVTDQLDERVIGDFLLFGTHLLLEKERTAYADIQRIPPAHRLVSDREQTQVERYWQLPIDPMLRYRKRQDYIEHFLEIFRAAVKDRIRTSHLMISLSGGMDSSTVAATIMHLITSGEVNADLHAITTVYDRIHPDVEGYYAGLVAHQLGIPIEFLVGDQFVLRDPLLTTAAEPLETFQLEATQVGGKIAAAFSPVYFTGDGSDEGLFDFPLIQVMSRLPWRDAAGLYLSLWRHNRQRPELGGLRHYLRSGRGQNNPAEMALVNYPVWLNPDFEKRWELRARKRAIWDWQPERPHPRSPLGYRTLVIADWQGDLEPQRQPDFTPPQALSPFLDVRVSRYLLSLPPQPWYKRKYLLRQAMKGALPEEVLKRRKDPLGFLLTNLLRQPGADWVNHWTPEPELAAYVRRDAIPQLSVAPGADLDANSLNMRPLLLNAWLRARRR